MSDDKSIPFDEFMDSIEVVDDSAESDTIKDKIGGVKGMMRDIVAEAPAEMLGPVILNILADLVPSMIVDASDDTLRAMAMPPEDSHPPSAKLWSNDEKEWRKPVDDERLEAFARRIQAVQDDYPELNMVTVAEGSVTPTPQGTYHTSVVLADAKLDETTHAFDTILDLAQHGKAAALLPLIMRIKAGSQELSNQRGLDDDGADE